MNENIAVGMGTDAPFCESDNRKTEIESMIRQLEEYISHRRWENPMNENIAETSKNAVHMNTVESCAETAAETLLKSKKNAESKTPEIDSPKKKKKSVKCSKKKSSNPTSKEENANLPADEKGDLPYRVLRNIAAKGDLGISWTLLRPAIVDALHYSLAKVHNNTWSGAECDLDADLSCQESAPNDHLVPPPSVDLPKVGDPIGVDVTTMSEGLDMYSPRPRRAPGNDDEETRHETSNGGSDTTGVVHNGASVIDGRSVPTRSASALRPFLAPDRAQMTSFKEDHKYIIDHLVELPHPPFTIRRLCELILFPEEHHSMREIVGHPIRAMHYVNSVRKAALVNYVDSALEDGTETETHTCMPEEIN